MYSSGGFRLVVRRGPQPNQVYELTQDIITIGRDVNNEITINDPEVSRHHCRLTRGPSGYTLEDLGSTNGTFVNGRRLTGAQPLNQGDLMGMGETVTLAYETSVGGAAPAPAAAPYGGGGAQPPAGGMGPGGDYAAGPPQGGPVMPDYQDQGQQGFYGGAPQPAFTPQPPPTFQPGPQYGGYPADQQGRGNRGCGLMIGCGILLVLGAVLMVVGIVVADTPLDDIPLVSDAINAVPLPGGSVDNAENFLKASSDCDAEEVQKYVCDKDQDAIASQVALCAATFEDISCEQDGSDVKCSYTQIIADQRTDVEEVYNIRSGKICGVVQFFSEFDTQPDGGVTDAE